MSEGEGIILGFDIRRGGEPFKDALRGEGVFLISSMGGVWIFSGMPILELSVKVLNHINTL